MLYSNICKANLQQCVPSLKLSCNYATNQSIYRRYLTIITAFCLKRLSTFLHLQLGQRKNVAWVTRGYERLREVTGRPFVSGNAADTVN